MPFSRGRWMAKDLPNGRLFRRRGGVVLVGRPVLALDGQNVLMQQVERIRRYLGTPLVDFFFFPVAVEAEGGVGEVLGKREAITSFTYQHPADLAPGVHFVDAPRRAAAAVGKRQQHFAFFALIRTVEPCLRPIRLVSCS